MFHVSKVIFINGLEMVGEDVMSFDDEVAALECCKEMNKNSSNKFIVTEFF